MCVFVGTVQAQSTASKPIKIVTNLPVGSGPDVFVRKVAGELSKKYSLPVVVENKPGSAGILAMEHYLSLPADGTSIFFGDFGSFVVMPILYNRENLIEQMSPLTNTYVTRWMIVTPTNIKTLDQLQAALKNNPRYGSWGVGSGGHMCGQELSLLLGVDATHIPYKDHGPWYVDLINGVLPFSCTSVGSSQSYQKSGKLNYVATAGNQRDSLYPEVPTVKELTKTTFQTGEVWAPFYINKKVDPAIASRFEKDLREIVSSASLQEQAKLLGGTAWGPSSTEMRQARDRESRVYRELIKRYNITVN
jgi:tripartite-type tricarboxylate transporter receptor subunit TctC